MNARDAQGRTPLHVALDVSSADRQLAELLLAHGADPTARDDESLFPGQHGWSRNYGLATVMVRLWWDRIAAAADADDPRAIEAELARVPEVLSLDYTDERQRVDVPALLHRAVHERHLAAGAAN